MIESFSFTDIIGTLAAILTTASTVPQAIKIIRTKKTRDLSLYMYLMLNTGIACWLIYGIAIASMPLILANAISLIFTFITLCYKLNEPKIDEDTHKAPLN